MRVVRSCCCCCEWSCFYSYLPPLEYSIFPPPVALRPQSPAPRVCGVRSPSGNGTAEGVAAMAVAEGAAAVEAAAVETAAEAPAAAREKRAPPVAAGAVAMEPSELVELEQVDMTLAKQEEEEWCSLM